MEWALRYAPHLGYLPPDLLPLFRASSGVNDLARHVHFAAENRMAGILYPWIVDRPAQERAAVREALRATSLECGCILYGSINVLLEPLWVSKSVASRKSLISHIVSTLDVAEEMGSRSIAVLIRGDQTTARTVQRRRAIESLRAIADIAAKKSVVLAIEPMKAIPDMLLQSFADAVDLVIEVAHPAVKLIFDTGHLTDMGDPLVESFIEAYEHISTIQLADMPGRVEPGSGEIDFTSLLAHAIRRGFTGLVDLEHDWVVPGEASEHRGLELLKEIDEAAKRAAAKPV
jgi:hydroxypyruvate isomerase